MLARAQRAWWARPRVLWARTGRKRRWQCRQGTWIKGLRHTSGKASQYPRQIAVGSRCAPGRRRCVRARGRSACERAEMDAVDSGRESSTGRASWAETEQQTAGSDVVESVESEAVYVSRGPGHIKRPTSDEPESCNRHKRSSLPSGGGRSRGSEVTWPGNDLGLTSGTGGRVPPTTNRRVSRLAHSLPSRLPDLAPSTSAIRRPWLFTTTRVRHKRASGPSGARASSSICRRDVCRWPGDASAAMSWLWSWPSVLRRLRWDSGVGGPRLTARLRQGGHGHTPLTCTSHLQTSFQKTPPLHARAPL